MRFLVGSKRGILLAQQTAANLQAQVGTIITIGRSGLPPVKLPVRGIISLPAADSLFQTVGAIPGAGIKAPPDNVVLMPLDTWHNLYDPVAKSQPTAVYTQVHVRLSRDLPRDPGAAFTQLENRARNLEARLAGTALVGNNIAAQLDAARADAIYAQLLFLFLGLPGVILAALLASVVGASGGDRRRREQALLRIRGASPVLILRLAFAETLLVGIFGTGLGVSGAAFAGKLSFGTYAFGATAFQAYTWVAVSVLLGISLALATIMLPAWRDARGLTVRAAQAVIGKPSRPLWSRIYLDIVFLAGSGLIFWQAMRNAYQVVLVPEGVPTISINYITLLAPLMLWIGSALFTWRISNFALTHERRGLSRIIRPISRELSGVVAASMSRQEKLLSRGLVIMALTASFAISIAIFNMTYMNQARVDAQLTNGSDVAIATSASSGLPKALPASAKEISGVVAVEPMQHRFGYVGNDLQDLYGINPKTIANAAPISDAFFQGGSAKQVLDKLTSRPDAILVSEETVKDFQLQPGDTIRIRLQSARDRAYHVVPFHYVGIAREFPTAPRDSFLIANTSYISRMTGSSAFETLLVKTSGSPPVVASRIRKLLGPASGAVVQDIDTQLKVTLSGLTALDLSGLTRLELVFAVILAIAASGLVLILGFAERRRTFAIAWALGARARQLSSFVWGEALFVTIGGVGLGTLAGWVLSLVIVKILTGVFDPPPEHLFIPWPYLALVLGTVAIAVIGAAVITIQAARKPALEVIRDL
jgi:putative ABC transport system permease protein